MSHNDTWMPLYIGDYLGDTMELDGAQHGAYLLLLMYYWRNGPLPIDDAKLAQIARTDIRLWKKLVGPVVRAFFHEQDGRLHQKRCDLELAKVEGISAKRRAAAGARWNGHAEPPPDGAYGDANASANASDVDMQTPSKPDANGDANGMLRAIARHLPSQSQKKEPPVGPRRAGTGATRSDGSNPRAVGTNPRALGTNPRAKPHRNAAHDIAREMDAEQPVTVDGTLQEVVDFFEFTGVRPKLVGGANG
jgi:uncharacterized protein YdaU (DUF1376 family)